MKHSTNPTGRDAARRALPAGSAASPAALRPARRPRVLSGTLAVTRVNRSGDTSDLGARRVGGVLRQGLLRRAARALARGAARPAADRAAGGGPGRRPHPTSSRLNERPVAGPTTARPSPAPSAAPRRRSTARRAPSRTPPGLRHRLRLGRAGRARAERPSQGRWGAAYSSGMTDPNAASAAPFKPSSWLCGQEFPAAPLATRRPAQADGRDPGTGTRSSAISSPGSPRASPTSWSPAAIWPRCCRRWLRAPTCRSPSPSSWRPSRWAAAAASSTPPLHLPHPDRPWYATNGDIWTRFSLRDLADFHAERDAVATLALARPRLPCRAPSRTDGFRPHHRLHRGAAVDLRDQRGRVRLLAEFAAMLPERGDPRAHHVPPAWPANAAAWSHFPIPPGLHHWARSTPRRTRRRRPGSWRR